MPLMSPAALRVQCLTRPLDPSTWLPLSAAEQARLRFSLMRGLSWNDWDQRPAWWWTAEHRTVLELKLACLASP